MGATLKSVELLYRSGGRMVCVTPPAMLTARSAAPRDLPLSRCIEVAAFDKSTH